MKTLLIDNFDSFTLSLYHLIAKINGEEPTLIRNNELTWDELLPTLVNYDAIYIGPGPGHPANEKDFGVCANVLKYTKIPTLGVCLGHQGLAQVFGGKVSHAKETMHGQISLVYHNETLERGRLFSRIPSPFEVVRYHSLAVYDLPACLESFAATEDDTIMAIRHKTLPFWGVQFHPESICTPFGYQILKNFADMIKNLSDLEDERLYGRISHSLTPPSSPRISPLSHEAISAPSPGVSTEEDPDLSDDDSHWLMNTPRISDAASPRVHPFSQLNDRLSTLSPTTEPSSNAPVYRVKTRKLEGVVNSPAVFEKLYRFEPTSFWLDSARVEAGLSRFSFMGALEGPRSFVLKYVETSKTLSVTRKVGGDEVTEDIHLGSKETLFDWMKVQLAHYETHNEDLPFDFNCGFVGYYGYEMKSECDSPPHPHALATEEQEKRLFGDSLSTPPDAAFIFADRVIAFDHLKQETYLLCLIGNDSQEAVDAEEWFDRIQTAISQSKTVAPLAPQKVEENDFVAIVAQHIRNCANSAEGSLMHLARPREEYLQNIAECLHQIKDGETYEVCLTTQIFSDAQVDPYDFYKSLRKRNPAPYGAFVRFGEKGSKLGTVLAGSSPERFLKVDTNRIAESKPIKGTLPRGKTPEEDQALKIKLQTSIKDFSENLMIVDLLRNDLGRVCEMGSVTVPRMMAVESYATVHQLVSTIQGLLKPSSTAIDAVRNCFPPGSMTGAPKYRTMAIIDELEKRKRGPYSGCLGFLSVGGAADLSVIIRTAIITDSGVAIGAGGAIVILSDPEEEFEEMILKARTVIPSIIETSISEPGKGLKRKRNEAGLCSSVNNVCS